MDFGIMPLTVYYTFIPFRWETLPDLKYRTDGHKMVLVEGIPTVFGWEHLEQYNGNEWRVPNFRLTYSRSAFTVTSVPGHLIPDCK